MPDAILMVADALTVLNRKRVFEFAAAQRLPAIYEYDFLVRDGGLMSYGAGSDGIVRARGGAGRPHLQGRQAGRPAVRAADPLSVRDQSEDRQGDRAGDPPPQLLALADEVIE